MGKVKAIKKAGGGIIEGYYCQAPFHKMAEDLTEAEIESAVPIQNWVGTLPGEGGSEIDGEFIIVREAVQVIEDDVTIEAVSFSTAAPAKAVGTLPKFVEIVPGSQKECTGFKDKNGTDIYLGDKIKYQAGIGDFEEYEVVFNSGRYTTNPAWPWGCNFSPFANGRCEVIKAQNTDNTTEETTGSNE